jgi:hypothetical protein
MYIAIFQIDSVGGDASGGKQKNADTKKGLSLKRDFHLAPEFVALYRRSYRRCLGLFPIPSIEQLLPRRRTRGPSLQNRI